jgi:hypothetical protein
VVLGETAQSATGFNRPLNYQQSGLPEVSVVLWS